VSKEVEVVVDIPSIQSEAELSVDLFNSSSASFDDLDLVYRFGLYPCLKGLKPFRIWTFRHLVMHDL